MKNLMMFLLCFMVFSLGTSCSKKECDFAGLDPVCAETVPTNEICQAAFLRWFYNVETGSCTEIGYSGCSQKGFETQEACEACECN